MTTSDNRPYPTMPGDAEYGKSLHMLVGELSGTVTALATQVGNMAQAVDAQTKSFSRIESAQRATTDDIRRLRHEVVTPDTLRSLGIRPDEPGAMRRDFEHLRALRVAADGRKPVIGHVRKTVAAAAIIAVLGWFAQRVAAPFIPSAPSVSHREEDKE